MARSVEALMLTPDAQAELAKAPPRVRDFVVFNDIPLKLIGFGKNDFAKLARHLGPKAAEIDIWERAYGFWLVAPGEHEWVGLATRSGISLAEAQEKGRSSFPVESLRMMTSLLEF